MENKNKQELLNNLLNLRDDLRRENLNNSDKLEIIISDFEECFIYIEDFLFTKEEIKSNDITKIQIIKIKEVKK